jgi:hypothetical protein
MVRMPTQSPTRIAASILQPPLGYRPLAWLGLVANVMAIPLGVLGIIGSPTWRIANVAVGASAALPTAALGIVACVALLRWRHWGQVLAIIALSMSLAVGLSYGIARLALVDAGRPALAVIAPLLWLFNLAVLIYWCRPAIRTYLR